MTDMLPVKFVEPAVVTPEYVSANDSGLVNCSQPFVAVGSSEVKLKWKEVVELAGAGPSAAKANRSVPASKVLLLVQ